MQYAQTPKGSHVSLLGHSWMMIPCNTQTVRTRELGRTSFERKYQHCDECPIGLSFSMAESRVERGNTKMQPASNHPKLVRFLSCPSPERYHSSQEHLQLSFAAWSSNPFLLLKSMGEAAEAHSPVMGHDPNHPCSPPHTGATYLQKVDLHVLNHPRQIAGCRPTLNINTVRTGRGVCFRACFRV